MRKRRRRCLPTWEPLVYISVMLVMLCSLVTGFLAVYTGRAAFVTIVMIVSILLMLAGLFVAFAIVRARSFAAKHDYCFCEYCGYLLASLGEAGRCPECGNAYTREIARQYWWRQYNSLGGEENP